MNVAPRRAFGSWRLNTQPLAMASMRIHKYLPLACAYFFINVPDVFPQGLMVTSILSPLFYFWLLMRRRTLVLETFFLALLPFALANMHDGIVWRDFIVSSLLMLTIYVTVYAFAVAIAYLRCIDQLFRSIIWINFWLALVGLVVRFTPWYPYMWQTLEHQESGGAAVIRFRMFSYEPSYYALLLSPLVLYCFWTLMRQRTWYNWRLFFAVLIPLMMSVSFSGAIACICGVIGTEFYLQRGTRKFKWLFGTLLALVVLFFALPDNSAVRQRIVAISQGSDTSVNARTIESFVAAYRMASSKDIWFGVGLGEVKRYGDRFLPWWTRDFARQFEPRLPCVVAENLAEFGLVGLALRFSLEFFFFWKTRPDRDRFRLSLFICMFVLQFGSGNKASLPEYVAWLLAFSQSVEIFPVPQLSQAENYQRLETVEQVYLEG